MPSTKKENFGSISNDKFVTIYTLRNTKGNELKVTDYGARIVSLRFRNKSFANKFPIVGYEKISDYENDEKNLGAIFIDGDTPFSKKIWNAEETVEGVKFSINENEKNISVIYSISNDNELSIKYETKGVEDITAALTFDGEIFKNPSVKVFSNDFKGENFGEWQIIDKPATVEFVEGMFGFDIGCPIDYYDAGLKNAAEIVSESENLILQVYAAQNKIQISNDLTIKTIGSKSENGIIKSQTVYILKNKK